MTITVTAKAREPSLLGLHDVGDQEQVGIRHAWFEVLERIASAPDQQLTMPELGHRLALTSGGVTRFLDRIVNARYITRTESPTDRRATLARLTNTSIQRCGGSSPLAGTGTTAPLSEYVNELVSAGLTIIELNEPPTPTEPTSGRDAEWTAWFAKIPTTLGLVCEAESAPVSGFEGATIATEYLLLATEYVIVLAWLYERRCWLC